MSRADLLLKIENYSQRRMCDGEGLTLQGVRGHSLGADTWVEGLYIFKHVLDTFYYLQE